MQGDRGKESKGSVDWGGLGWTGVGLGWIEVDWGGLGWTGVGSKHGPGRGERGGKASPFQVP